MHRDVALRDLIRHLFSGEMRRFFALLERFAPNFTEELTPRQSTIDTLEEVIRLFHNRGLLAGDEGRRFFHEILRERPHCGAEIDRIFRLDYPEESLFVRPPPSPEDITAQVKARASRVLLLHSTEGRIDVPLLVVARDRPSPWQPGNPVSDDLALTFHRDPHPHLFLEPPHCLRYASVTKAQTIDLDARRPFELIQRQPHRKVMRVDVDPGERHGAIRAYAPSSGLRFHVQSNLAGRLVALTLPPE